MRNAIRGAVALFLGATVAYVEMDFDQRYERVHAGQ